MTIRELRSGNTEDLAMTRGEYFGLRDSDPRPWPEPVQHLLAAIADAPDETWRSKAACKGMTHLFFPEGSKRSTYGPARQICDTCPVQAECAESGADEVHGVWGGMSPRERSRARKGRPRPPRREIVGNVTFRHPPEVRAAAERLIVNGWQDSHVSRKVNVPQRTILDWRRALGVKRGPGGVAA